MGIKTNSLLKSLWVFHFGSATCNNCDIEVLDALTPRYDLERFGIQLAGSIRHADVMLVCGFINKKVVPKFKEIYTQMPAPKLVVAIGGCACSGGMFTGSYNFFETVDKIVPVAAYIPGCPPKPEAIIAGVVKLVTALKGSK